MTLERGGPIDMHVHLVGNGSSGSDCWLRMSWFHRFLAPIMLRQMGLPLGALRGDLDREYEKVIIQLAETSTLSAIVLLAHEQVYDRNGRRIDHLGTMYVPNDYLFSVAAKHPKFLPAVSIHPARLDALDELDRCIEMGAVMMKCLPNCQNIDCSDEGYRPFWEKMAKAGLPLLAHTGGEMSLQVVEKRYEDPRSLRLPLECGVTVIAAHAATASHPFDPDYFPVLAEMMNSYPRLYADISALNTPFRSQRLKDCLQEPLLSRIVHGSDVPISVSGYWARLRGLLTAEEHRRLQSERNPMEKDYQLKRAMGFPAEVFSRLWSLLPTNTSSP